MKFYMDEDIPKPITKGLKNRGFDVKTVGETERREAPDIEHLKYAAEKGKIVVTADQDFLRLEKREDHAGILFLVNQEMRTGKAIRDISRIADRLEAEGMKNHVEFV